jgi:hypothetical protein
VVWWDEALLEQKGTAFLSNRDALLSVADFNCPGSGRMFLDGAATEKNGPERPKGTVALTKTGGPLFPDVWDYVIDNFTQGTNDPYVIDSIAALAFTPIERTPVATPVKEAQPIPPQQPVASNVFTIEEKFKTREKIIAAEIPVAGDSIELRFYDNAEIDGDSISLFLNGRLLFEHIRLTEKAFTIKIPSASFADTAELVMVAENLGTIPPNTSYMVALSGSRRYEARLASTERSSAFIRLKKEPAGVKTTSR